MIRAIFLRNIRHHLGLLGVLSLGLFLFQLAMVWFAARLDLGPQFRAFLQTLIPPGLVDVIFNQFGFGSFAGTISFGYQHPLVLISGIALVIVMATVPAQERESEILELILSKPVPRRAYLGANLLSVLFTVLLISAMVLAGSAFGLMIVVAPVDVGWTDYLPSALVLFLLLMAVGSYGLLFSTEAPRRGIATAQAVGITLLFYWLDFMGDYWDLLETARYLSPFFYFDPARAAQAGLAPRDIWVLLGISLALVPAAFLNFQRQDL